MAQNTASKQLFDLLVSRDFDPELLDSSGRPALDPQETEIFSFDFRAQSGKDYGTVVLMIGDDNNLEVFCADNVGKTMEDADKNEWFAFLQQLKHFAVKNFMEFNIKNLNRLRYSMQGQAAIKEGLFESWSGNRTTSWTGVATEARLMIKHKKALDENDARFRYVESLFIETTDGERFKLPFTKLAGGRAMLEHVRQGGKPYDLRGQHIVSIVEELNILNRFRRANHGQIFEGDTAQLVTETDAYYKNLQHNLKTLEKRSGYQSYFENWNPADISEQDVVIESLKNLFVKQTIDTRIEQALPLLARIQQQGQQMKEANIFESWINNLAEGTWQTPDTPEKQEKLLALLSADLPVGPDATNATEQLYDLLGDDVLFDQLENLAQKDANADARQVVIDRMQELSDDPDVLHVINALNVDSTAEMNPPDATNPMDLEPADEMAEAIKDATTQTEDPAGTQQPSYPEYQDDLSSVLKHAGVEPQNNPAPDYEEEVAEGQMNQVSMFYDDWINSEYAPMDDEAGDDNAVMAKAKAFLRGEVVPEKIDAIAQILTQQYHGGDFNEGKNEQLDEFLPALAAVGGALARGVVGAGVRAKIASELDNKEETTECGDSPLAGQYGHSGKMKEVSKDISFLDRLKELSGLRK